MSDLKRLLTARPDEGAGVAGNEKCKTENAK
jgi:hypothetical protein